ncbi:hypothetical protein SRHO_G00247070 [Serrasalmus rhombeus]
MGGNKISPPLHTDSAVVRKCGVEMDVKAPPPSPPATPLENEPTPSDPTVTPLPKPRPKPPGPHPPAPSIQRTTPTSSTSPSIRTDLASTLTSDPSTPPHPPSLAPPTGPASRGPVRRSFAAVAKQVVLEGRLRKEQAMAQEEEDEPDEDLTFEELLEKAKGGDPKAQSNLGKHYLKLALESDADVNNRQAVEWLLRAAKQGRRDAARLLQRCWIQKKGITPETEAEVRRLSTESKFEQAVRRAAMMMYWKLNPDKKQKMTMSEMLENVGQVNAGPASQYVDAEGFVEMTKNYAQGITPSTAGAKTGSGQNNSLESRPSASAQLDQA